jgi:hypothetical protein
MARPSEGFRSDTLRAALQEALGGKPARLVQLLCTAGSITRSGQPSLGVAEAFGVEVASLPGVLAPLLTSLGSEDAAADSPRAYLPIVAAHGWAARLRGGREVEPAWAALGELSADSRGPVRLGVLAALCSLSTREGAADGLVAHALFWLEHDDRDQRLAGAGLVLEALSDRQLLAGLRDEAALLDYLARVITEIVDAPRAAERWASRRRALRSLPAALSAPIAFLPGRDGAVSWLSAQCEAATHPDLRAALDDALEHLRRSGVAHATRVVESLTAALQASAKPRRDAARERPGTGRGRRARRLR